jgi:L-fuconate dehydratase
MFTSSRHRFSSVHSLLWEWGFCDRIGPEKGVIHIASAAVNNALWDMYARSRRKPLWKLVVDMTPEELVRSAVFRYISDAISKEEALAVLRVKLPGKREREAEVREYGSVE